jgi:NADPH:quinone reductase-like Zn-dependent oxidoreductase
VSLRVVVRRFGVPADVAGVERYDGGSAGPGQVLVRMRLCSVNPSDVLPISGAYPSRTLLPFVPGFEGVGVVEATGPDVDELVVGQRVLPIGSDGAWQDVKIAEARWCFPVPADLSDAEAARSYVNPLTAGIILDRHLPDRADAHVAVNAAGSAIGLTLLRLLNRCGMRPIALVRSRASRARLAAVDTAATLCITEGDHEAEVRALTGGRGLDLAFDAVGGDQSVSLARALRPGGTLVRYGLLSGQEPSPPVATIRPDVQVALFWLRRWVHSAGRAELAAALERAFALVRDDTAAAPVAGTYPLVAVRDALRHHDASGRRGKILLRPGS